MNGEENEFFPYNRMPTDECESSALIIMKYWFGQESLIDATSRTESLFINCNGDITTARRETEQPLHL